MDVHVPSQITDGLRARAVDVLRAQDDGFGTAPDPILLDRATSSGRVLFSQDEDLLAEAAARQRDGREFSGLIYAHQLRITIGQCIDHLELAAKACEPPEMVNQVLFFALQQISGCPGGDRGRDGGVGWARECKPGRERRSLRFANVLVRRRVPSDRHFR